MPALFRRADRHRPVRADQHEFRREAARAAYERSRRETDLDRFRLYWHVR